MFFFTWGQFTKAEIVQNSVLDHRKWKGGWARENQAQGVPEQLRPGRPGLGDHERGHSQHKAGGI